MLSYIRPRIPHFREYGLTFFDGYNHYSCIKNDAFSLSLSRLSCVYIFFFLFLSLPYLILSFSFSRDCHLVSDVIRANRVRNRGIASYRNSEFHDCERKEVGGDGSERERVR